MTTSPTSKRSTAAADAPSATSATPRPSDWPTCPRHRSPSTRHGWRSLSSPRTCSPGPDSSPSTATSPTPNPNGSATACSTPPPSSSAAADNAGYASATTGPGPPISSPRSNGCITCHYAPDHADAVNQRPPHVRPAGTTHQPNHLSPPRPSRTRTALQPPPTPIAQHNAQRRTDYWTVRVSHHDGAWRSESWAPAMASARKR